MVDIKNQCLRCGSEMETGFMLDRDTIPPFGTSPPRVPTWIEGSTENSDEWNSSFKLAGKRMRQVNKAYRCVKCGYLELYANSEVSYG